jgi:hypothetical protein
MSTSIVYCLRILEIIKASSAFFVVTISSVQLINSNCQGGQVGAVIYACISCLYLLLVSVYRSHVDKQKLRSRQRLMLYSFSLDFVVVTPAIGALSNMLSRLSPRVLCRLSPTLFSVLTVSGVTLAAPTFLAAEDHC